jgi:hypothetical protein
MAAHVNNAATVTIGAELAPGTVNGIIAHMTNITQ